ncbi:hypothetical protein CEXT_152801 [Caerostris extrusa]|uniref:Uncharacterized protein n=1 Tax=Caerostris extrusa TaxID=172846 RepID=A0AAV4TUK4_CAEEX|nr:hypothetical protein CEXT_152801 [Caerostris extrusa]
MEKHRSAIRSNGFSNAIRRKVTFRHRFQGQKEGEVKNAKGGGDLQVRKPSRQLMFPEKLDEINYKSSEQKRKRSIAFHPKERCVVVEKIQRNGNAD